MKVAFTICSANHLPFAKTVADSLVEHNPEYRFFIALADTEQPYDAAFFAPHTIVPVTTMAIEPLQEMNRRYDIFELSCALKPFVAAYLFHTLPACEALFYFDTDILIYGALTEAEMVLKNHSIVVTPHLQTAQPFAVAALVEQDVLRTGLYNAGFFGLKRDAEAFSFLDWWKERVLHLGYNKAAGGLFVDQFWLNFVPLYFPGSYILRHPGYNLAYWNFHERSLSEKEGRYYVNEVYPLVFLHFSGFEVRQPQKPSRHQREPSPQWPQYQPLFGAYAAKVLRNNAPDLLGRKPGLGRQALAENNNRPLLQKFRAAFQKKK